MDSKVNLNRRDFFVTTATAGGALLGAGLLSSPAKAAPVKAKRYQEGVSPWPLVLNTSTIRPASLEEKIRVTAEAGWDGIEPWIDELGNYEKEGGDLKELGAQIRELGLYIPNVIGLWDAMPATPETFQESLKVTKERMRQCAAVGSQHVAAIPAPDRADFDLAYGAQQYRELLKIGREEYGITVAFEFVGFMKGVHRFGQATAVALDANDREACLIMDTFHLFRGGSGFDGISKVQGNLIANFHWNDVPGDVPREEQGDEHRLYPGDGILPLTQVLQDLKATGYDKALSLEIFNRAYWEQPAEQVSRDGLQKMRECVAAAEV